MKLAIRYRAVFRYEREAGLSPHHVRLFPRRDAFTDVLDRKFMVDGNADVQYRQDLFDNETAVCFFPRSLRELNIVLDLELLLRERNPFHFLLAKHALTLPLTYLPGEAEALAPYLGAGDGVVTLPAEFLVPPGTPTVDALVGLNAAVPQLVRYEHREEGDPFSPEETLRRGSGSCRDSAVLFLEVCRRQGLAARLVSGFLWEEETGERKADNALHEWVEAYLPGAGWVGMDPSCGVFADHHRIPAAVGIRHSQVAPVEGHYYGNEAIASTLETSLNISPI